MQTTHYCLATLALAALPLIDHLLAHLGWYISGAIAVVGLLAFGLTDVLRMSISRAWAISSVVFRESIRRRVLWITPLAVLGMIVVSQLQHPSDEQDAIRQTIKFCLFASGMVVVVTALILACTNLPKEIESRVIYTIVTKPTTRLEIVLGKVMGFARVSAAILLIMGVFTFGYLELRAWRMRGYLADRLAAEPARSPDRTVLEHYRDAGLLSTRAVEQADDLQIYMRPPAPGKPRWMAGGMGQAFRVPFNLSAGQKEAMTRAVAEGRGVVLVNTLPYKRHDLTAEELDQFKHMNGPVEESETVTVGPTLGPTPLPRPIPVFSIVFFSDDFYRLIDTRDLPEGGNQPLPSEKSDQPSAYVPLSPQTVQRLTDAGKFWVSIAGATPGIEYAVPAMPLVFAITDDKGVPSPDLIKPALDRQGRPEAPTLSSMSGRYGMQIASRADGISTLACYSFRDANAGAAGDGDVTFEVRAGIEHGGDEEALEAGSQIGLEVVNLSDGKNFQAKFISPESGRLNYVKAPRAAVAGGQFDVYLRALTKDQWLGVQRSSVAVATANRSFAFNLFKSLLILWLLSVLVAAVSVFCSTFLSWPIAVVLTLMILLGHWGVMELSDSLNSDLGATVTTGTGLDPGRARVVRTSVNALARTLKTVAAVLPDISRFPATEDIERGISIPPAKIGDALKVLLMYGVPVVVLSYLFLKFKEVAP